MRQCALLSLLDTTFRCLTPHLKLILKNHNNQIMDFFFFFFYNKTFKAFLSNLIWDDVVFNNFKIPFLPRWIYANLSYTLSYFMRSRFLISLLILLITTAMNMSFSKSLFKMLWKVTLTNKTHSKVWKIHQVMHVLFFEFSPSEFKLFWFRSCQDEDSIYILLLHASMLWKEKVIKIY